MWGRLSPHPAFESADDGRRRVRPTRVAPLAVFLREDAEWLLAGEPPSASDALSHAGARSAGRPRAPRRIVLRRTWRSATGRLASEVEDALWELVAAGLVTADGFENLRALVDPKRRRGEGRGKHARPRHAAGRWALLRHAGGRARRLRRKLRAPVAPPLGRGVPRPAGARNAGARRGAICSSCCAAWKRAASCAAAASPPPSSASSSPSRKPSTFSAPSAASPPPNRPTAPSPPGRKRSPPVRL